MRAAEFLQRCLDAGMPTDMALIAMRAFEAEVEVVIDLTLDKRRSADRARQAKKRELDNVKSRDVTLQAVTDVTSREQRDAKDAPAPTYTRGEDNLSRLVDNNLTTPNFASEPDLDWPGEAKPSKAYLDRLEAALREAGGAALDPTATKLFVLTPILALGRVGKGPVCDLQTDVLPTIRARSMKAAPQSIGGWDYFTKACLEARDRRLAGAGEVRAIRPSAHATGPPQTIGDRIADEQRRATAMTLQALSVANG